MVDTQQRRSPCSLCKHITTSCPEGCFFAPFFPPESPNADQELIDVHTHFGLNKFASIVEAAAADDDPARRMIIADSLKFEARARRHDPVLGATGLVKVVYARMRDAQQLNYGSPSLADGLDGNTVCSTKPTCYSEEDFLRQFPQAQSSKAHDAIPTMIDMARLHNIGETPDVLQQQLQDQSGMACAGIRPANPTRDVEEPSEEQAGELAKSIIQQPREKRRRIN